MERETGIKRTTHKSYTQDDAVRLEKRILGRSWGKRRAPGRPPK